MLTSSMFQITTDLIFKFATIDTFTTFTQDYIKYSQWILEPYETTRMFIIICSQLISSTHPRPVPVGSPPCIIKSDMIRWKIVPL